MSYFKVKNGNAVAFDVDGTLVSWEIPNNYNGNLDDLITIETNGYKEQVLPNTHNIEFLKKLKKRYYSIIVWSAGNSDWAESVVKALGLEDYVDVIMPKLDFHVDDVKDPYDKIGKWKYIDFNGEKTE